MQGLPRSGAADGWPATSAPTGGALDGLRVLDLSRILSGPFCTMILADLGADVLKIERCDGGDDTRQWGPPYQGEESSYFLAVNRNKRGMAVDLRNAEGLAIVRRLAANADVLIENFRPGVAARLGMGYDELARCNSRLVYASISGFGQTGPFRDEPGYDAIAQALSGLMSVTGEFGGPPVRVGVSSADLGAGMWTAIGILAALNGRAATGHGQAVDVSLLDGQVAWLTYVAGGHFASGETPQRYGSAHPSIVPYQAFGTADADLMVAVGNDKLWLRFIDVIGIGELAGDPRFVTNSDRIENREELLPLITARLKTRRAEEWARLLSAAGIPAAPINSVGEALRHPQVVARDMVVDLEHPTAGHLKTVASPIKLSAQPTTVRTPPPTHGQHTNDILASLGYGSDAIAELRAAGAVR